MADTDEEIEAVLAACTRHLHGHGAHRPADVLRALANDAGDDARDTYGGGDVIRGFEANVAELLGKPAGVFMPSGTMAQQIALRIWADRKRLPTVAYHPTCHLEIHEQKGLQRLHGIESCLVGRADRALEVTDVQAIAEPVAALLLELPQREIGGVLPTWESLTAQCEWARANDVALHLDGARLWECGPYYDKSYADIASLFDTVYVSFYKGLGGIAGAVLAGPSDLIDEARIWQRRHGGNLVSLYPYVIAARCSLRARLDRFGHYHERAVAVARVLASVPGVRVTPNPPHTNMMHVFFAAAPDEVMARVIDVAREERVRLFRRPRPCAVPDTTCFEVAIGDAADELTDDELVRLAQRVAGV
jgi:threonine aldolase